MNEKLSTEDITKIAIFTALLVVCTWVSIPMIVPFTMQTFAVFLSLLLLGGKNALLVVITYILIGITGVPVFANFKGGLVVLFGLTGGYIIGFIFQCVCYMLVTKVFGENIYIKIIGLLIGLCVCYIVGTLWFVRVYNLSITGNIDSYLGFKEAFILCVVPYIVPDLLKLALSLVIYKKIKRYI